MFIFIDYVFSVRQGRFVSIYCDTTRDGAAGGLCQKVL